MPRGSPKVTRVEVALPPAHAESLPRGYHVKPVDSGLFCVMGLVWWKWGKKMDFKGLKGKFCHKQCDLDPCISFPIAAVTHYLKLSGLKHYKFVLLQF